MTGARIFLMRTPWARMKGLLGRSRLRPRLGVCLIPCRAVHTFGMRFPIDVVFFDREGRVLKTFASLPVNRVATCLRARGALELAPGSVRLRMEVMAALTEQLTRLKPTLNQPSSVCRKMSGGT